ASFQASAAKDAAVLSKSAANPSVTVFIEISLLIRGCAAIAASLDQRAGTDVYSRACQHNGDWQRGPGVAISARKVGVLEWHSI
ncbi:hypothetical protein, partial [Mesorhizobium sp. B2-4-11]|uniref:hypothetical protein n=1 Tax=Mesorhizobium sp. B2-4-11 TaxID=2589938 RepID=UPI001AEF1214